MRLIILFSTRDQPLVRFVASVLILQSILDGTSQRLFFGTSFWTSASVNTMRTRCSPSGNV